MQIGKIYDVDEFRLFRRNYYALVVGTPLTKVYVLAEHPDPKQQHYLNFFINMGEGPLYSFFIPYHLVHFEVPNSIARVVLFLISWQTHSPGSRCRSLRGRQTRFESRREILDDYGMYMTYGEAVNVDEMSQQQYLPEGLVEGCKIQAQRQK